MPTRSIDDDNSPSRKVARDLRDSWLFRVAVLAVVLLLAFGLARGCASQGRNVSSDEAVEIARNSTDFEPERVQVRFVQQGIPPHPYWAVSLYDVDAGGRPTEVKVVLVDASTGQIIRRSG